MRIRITEHDIAVAGKPNRGHCPLACALKRRYPDAKNILVGPRAATYLRDGYPCDCILESDAILWIHAYDKGKNPGPATVTIH